MLLTITKKELERIEKQMLPGIKTKICENKKVISVLKFWSFIFITILASFLYNGASFIVGFIVSFLCYALIVCLTLMCVLPIENYSVEIPTKKIKNAIIERLKKFYLPSDNIELLKTLYEKSLLAKDQKEKLEQFLVENDKNITD